MKHRDAAATRERILEAAVREFTTSGFDARIEDIVAAADVNRRMAYHYFGSKEELYLAALEKTYLDLVAAEQAIDVDALDPLEAVERLVNTKFEHHVRFPHYVEFLKLENLYRARNLRSSSRIREMRAPLFSILARVLERGEALGVFRPGIDPLDLYIAICALCHFTFSNQHTMGAIFDLDMTSPQSLSRRRQTAVAMISAFLLPSSGAEFVRRTQGTTSTKGSEVFGRGPSQVHAGPRSRLAEKATTRRARS